ncbi:alpha-xylosidase [Nocardia sp. ET3-3]|uniref:alpha-D-xyloside xylohydrolase n=1 Tax=Nocardia terrae TaxID=2675851 RepID=A0A7K1UUY1_9NOCA|nr:alpha-xylosidase [Nocardia terrae]MVU78092.1 alpha-xylosidase [Nocardia terrae]
MKFTDGYWLMRPGVHADYPAEVYDIDCADGELTVYAPVTPIRKRGDLLKGPLLTLTCSAPLDDVISVRITHFRGGTDRGPRFELDAAGEARIDADAPALTSGALTVRFDRDDWRMVFEAEGRVLTASGTKAMAMLDTPEGRHLREQLDLGVGTQVYGLGERFGPLVKNGQSVDIWNADGGTASEQAYKNVPFALTDAGYGVFVNHPGHVSFEVASEAVSRLQFSVPGEELEYLIVYGPTPKQILSKYTALTGRPARLPAWSFGLWLSTSFTTPYDEETVTAFLDGMTEHELPLSVFHFDCFWMREYNWCDFTWDSRVFPDPTAMLRRLAARGLRICLWINPYVGQRSPLFEEGRAHGYLLRRADGSVWQWDLWQPGLAVVDFTNPAARQWYTDKLSALLDMGVDCFKTDFGERIPTDVVYHDGSDPHRMHNYYAQLYNRTVFELLRKRRGEGQAVVFARSATAGGQQFPVHWGGDCESSFPAMAESLRGGLSLGLSGFGYWSHDIGGFEGTPDPELFKRWIAFGLLSSHSRLHGSESVRVPWAFDEESVEVLRSFTGLKLALMPYLAAVAEQAHTLGWPMMRAMMLEFPHDPACAHLDRQYMLGPDLLVAPVFSADGTVSYYLPQGIWTRYLTGEPVVGGRWIHESHDVHSLPLLVRPGAVVPVGAVTDRPDYDHAEGVTLRCYRLRDDAEVVTSIPAGSDAVEFRTVRVGDEVRVNGPRGEWRVLLVGCGGADEISGGTVQRDPLGLLLSATGPTVIVRGLR